MYKNLYTDDHPTLLKESKDNLKKYTTFMGWNNQYC
jgi:hypothetical protein